MSRLRHAPIALNVALAPVSEMVCLLLLTGVGAWAAAMLTRALAHISQARVPAPALDQEIPCSLVD